jgi:hypothetical protein
LALPLKKKKLVTRRHIVSDEALRASLRVAGQFTPVFRLGGVIVDGRRRDRFLRELGRSPHVVDVHTQREAARVLWHLHPYHALVEYCSELSLGEAAELLDVTLADIAIVRGETRKHEQGRSFGDWRPNYRARWESARRYVARVRQGLEPLTVGGVERALRLPRLQPQHRQTRGTT